MSPRRERVDIIEPPEIRVRRTEEEEEGRKEGRKKVRKKKGRRKEEQIRKMYEARERM